MATAQPFFWGAGGQKISSPEAAARSRKVAEALMNRPAADSWQSGLANVTNGIAGMLQENRVDEAEAAGREKAGGLFANLAVNADPNSIIAALTSPDAAWASPAQTSIASALLNNGLERSDPIYQLQRQKLEQEVAAMGQPQPIQPIEINGQLINPQTMEVMGDFRSNEAPAAPSGYQWAEGGLSPIPGGPADPAFANAAKPPTDAQRKANSLFAVVEPDAQLLLGDGTPENPGIFNDLGDGGSQAWNGVGAFGVTPLAPLASPNFQAAKDAVTNIAQSYLYAMSGAAAPAEEVKKIADLVTPNPGDSPQRKEEKRRRLQSYIDAIAVSTIPTPMTQNTPGQPANATSSGIQWSIEP